MRSGFWPLCVLRWGALGAGVEARAAQAMYLHLRPYGVRSGLRSPRAGPRRQ